MIITPKRSTKNIAIQEIIRLMVLRSKDCESSGSEKVVDSVCLVVVSMVVVTVVAGEVGSESETGQRH